MLIPGSVFQEEDNVCYGGIFKTKNGRPEVWYIGNTFMNTFYMVFDQTDYDNLMINKMWIGIAKKNEYFEMGDSVYNDKDPEFDPENLVGDTSKDMHEVEDPYKAFIAWTIKN